MESLSDVRNLDGTLDVLVAEDGIHVAHVTSTAAKEFKGSFVTLRHGKAVSRLGLGLSLFSIALSILHCDEHLTGKEYADLDEELRELIRGNEAPRDDIPF